MVETFLINCGIAAKFQLSCGNLKNVAGVSNV